MIERYVVMSFQIENLNDFLIAFNKNKDSIASFDGCKQLELIQNKNVSNRFMTFSLWTSEEHLEAYRKSELFSRIWSNVKPYFIEKPYALTIHPNKNEDQQKKKIFLAKFEF